MNSFTDLNVNTILSVNGSHRIELLHRADDPGIWIVRSSDRYFWFGRKYSSVWFLDKQQALTFAKGQAEEKRTEQRNARKANG